MSEHSDGEVLNAIDGSIEKWEKIVSRDGANYANVNCPLCQLFEKGGGCYACPVNKDGKHYDCNNTPYKEFTQTVACGDRVTTITEEKLAQAELDFLQQVRTDWLQEKQGNKMVKDTDEKAEAARAELNRANEEAVRIQKEREEQYEKDQEEIRVLRIFEYTGPRKDVNAHLDKIDNSLSRAGYSVWFKTVKIRELTQNQDDG